MVYLYLLSLSFSLSFLTTSRLASPPLEPSISDKLTTENAYPRKITVSKTQSVRRWIIKPQTRLRMLTISLPQSLPLPVPPDIMPSREWRFWRCHECGDCNREDRRRCRNPHCGHRGCRYCRLITRFMIWRCSRCGVRSSEIYNRCTCGHRQCSNCTIGN